MPDSSRHNDPARQTLAATRRMAGLLLVPVLVLLGVLTALQYRQAEQDAERELERQLDAYARELSALSSPALMHLADLRRILEAGWAAPPNAGPALGAAMRRSAAADPSRELSLDSATETERARWGQVWWADAAMPEPSADWLRRAETFATVARAVHARTPGFENTWFAAMDVNTSFGYPWVPTSQILSAMGVSTLAGIAPARAQGARHARARVPDLAGALGRGDVLSRWGPPYVSQINGHLVVSHTVPVIQDAEMVGELSLDVRIDGLQQRVTRWRHAGMRDWIIDARRRVLADSEHPLREPAGNGLADTHVERELAAWLPAGLTMTDVDAAVARRGHVVRRGEWLLLAASHGDSPWTYLRALRLADLRWSLWPTLVPNALIGVALLAMFLVTQWLLARFFVNPAVGVLDYLERLSIDEHAEQPRLHQRWRPWLEAIARTFSLQRELQRKERQREAFKSAIVDHALTAIIATDGEGRIVEFNPAAAAMFGHRQSDVIGQPVDVIIPERLRQAHRTGMQRLRGGAPGRIMGKRLEMPALRADGSELPVEMVIWRTEVDGSTHYSASMVDLTDRHRAEQEIERQREALHQSEKLSAMGSLLAGVAHELNNPLAIVTGRAGLLEEQLQDVTLKDGARRIREAAERCGRIVRTFLNMARSRPPQRREASVNDVVTAAVEMLTYALRTHDVRVVYALGELPPISIDPDRVGQIIVNLVVNAQHALTGQSAPRQIELSTFLVPTRAADVGGTGPAGERGPGPGDIAVRVRDNGPGVPPEVRAHIFEPFFTTKAEGLGTGLGLSVSRRLAREQGGDLVLEQTDAGASFLLTLPRTGADGIAGVDKPSLPRACTEYRVLVVDDETEIADLLRTYLEREGHEVATADSAAVALEMLEMARFDAIVSDVRMPDMDGAGLWRAVAARHPALARRTMFITGDTFSADGAGLPPGTSFFQLEKPFTREALLHLLARMMAGEAPLKP